MAAAAARLRTDDISRGLLLIVAVLAALLGLAARAASGQEHQAAPRSSSRRVQPVAAASRTTADPPAQPPAHGIVETFVLRSVSTIEAEAKSAPAIDLISSYPSSKRWVAGTDDAPATKVEASAVAVDAGSTLNWRTREPKLFHEPATAAAFNQASAAPNSSELPTTGNVPSAANESTIDRAERQGFRVRQAADWAAASTDRGQSIVRPAQDSRLTQNDPPSEADPPLVIPELSGAAPADPLPAASGAENTRGIASQNAPENAAGSAPPAVPAGEAPADQGPSALEDLIPPRPPEAAEAQTFRDANCGAQHAECDNAWRNLQSRSIEMLPIEFLDITPRFSPKLSYGEHGPPTEREVIVADNAARRKQLDISIPRTWKDVGGRPVEIHDGELFFPADHADADVRGLGDRPPPDAPDVDSAPILVAKFIKLVDKQTAVAVRTAKGKEFSLPLHKLSLEDQQWITWTKGRTWVDREGQQIAVGRFVDFKWGRIIIENHGRRVAVPVSDLGDNELCYVGAYWGEGVGLPEECRMEGKLQVRDFTLLAYHWKASALCHKPLYFEEVELERYGHSHGPLAQPVISTAHFFGNIAVLPYKMGINPPGECMYALGYYRPGSCAPYMIPSMPYSIRGGLYQAGAVVGGIALFP